eukprot:TRINITY_DN17298_c0_g1_i1.p1 TRINITY_DN17298_c0_g1~~TRINITY_DN17298_c0_g1_i1.p1  ORF type:complete len:380 (+),score=98.20 TRINITY_DN17298_c0_g1_i1:108-1142(+)
MGRKENECEKVTFLAEAAPASSVCVQETTKRKKRGGRKKHGRRDAAAASGDSAAATVGGDADGSRPPSRRKRLAPWVDGDGRMRSPKRRCRRVHLGLSTVVNAAGDGGAGDAAMSEEGETDDVDDSLKIDAAALEAALREPSEGGLDGDELVCAVCEQLHERNRQLTSDTLRVLGRRKLVELLQNVLHIEASGGMECTHSHMKGVRRTPGGVLFRIARDACNKEQRRALFPPDPTRQQQRQRQQQQQHEQQHGQQQRPHHRAGQRAQRQKQRRQQLEEHEKQQRKTVGDMCAETAGMLAAMTAPSVDSGAAAVTGVNANADVNTSADANANTSTDANAGAGVQR